LSTQPIKFQQKTTALYCRLSKDDEYVGDSSSIQTQKAMLEKYAYDNGMYNLELYVDDGYSGTNFDRPDFQRLLTDIENGKISTVITKDLSRLGREYLQTGYYTEIFFPQNNIRYIAINDGVDSKNGENEFMPFKNIINEWYAKDISRKVKSAKKIKAEKGEFLGSFVPYGYKRSTEIKNKLIIDEETAPTIRKMFELAANGMSVFKIARYLENQKILKPQAKAMHERGKFVTEQNIKSPYRWVDTAVHNILKNIVYLGHVAYGKQTKKSFKSKKLYHVPKEQWIVVKNTHEQLIDEETFNLANKNISIKKRVVKSTGEVQIFQGLLYCADCGSKMSFDARKNQKLVGTYTCGKNRSYGTSYCSSHYSYYDSIYDLILKDINNIITNAKLNTNELAQKIRSKTNVNSRKEQLKIEKEITLVEKRIDELDFITKKLYEESVLSSFNGNKNGLPKEKLDELLNGYYVEQQDLKQKTLILKASLAEFTTKQDQTKKFVDLVLQYENIEILTSTILKELIDKIVVHESVYPEGFEPKKNLFKQHPKTQQIDIHYKFIGNINQLQVPNKNLRGLKLNNEIIRE